MQNHKNTFENVWNNIAWPPVCFCCCLFVCPSLHPLHPPPRPQQKFTEIFVLSKLGENKQTNIKIFNSKLSFARVSEQWTSLEGASKALAYLSYPQENIGFILTIEINGCCLSSLIRKPVFPMKVGKVLWV